MFDKELQKAFNQQVNNEMSSAYLYLSMSVYCESVNLPGIAHWLRVQYQEEMEHGMKFIDFIRDRGGRVLLSAIPQPPIEFKSALDIFEQTLAHEQKVTFAINQLYELALQKKDYPSQVFLQWFITEQVEEEKDATQIVENLKVLADKPHSIIYMDKQLGKRAK
jgi:ferritin